MSTFLIDARNQEKVLAALDEACAPNGLLEPMPALTYSMIPQNDLSLWCLQRGLYCLPTTELIEWLRAEIGGKSAIEIGAGNGCIGRELGIPMTDSRMQEKPEIAALYGDLGQGVVQYGQDVDKMPANQAIAHYKPDVVIAAWVTHRYDKQHPGRGGNMWGVREDKIIDRVKKYIFIGNERTHRQKPILQVRHKTYRLPFLYSRSPDPRNVVWVWE